MWISSETRVKNVRAYAGLQDRDWEILLEIALDEAKKLQEADPEITWGHIVGKKVDEVAERINLQLRQNGVIEVDNYVVKYVVSRRLISQKSQKSLKNSAGKNGSPSTAISPPEKSKQTEQTKRPYDPIRDV
ncbi:hypothetical protein AA0121_g13431 [Alternaria tenuissima]|uniref:Uncharacterized protein n=1 Tax=Alternaria tenuissima TaxID=119927 RepID=A0AB37VXJ1_9PLEO|nr:hypothetical protein AA0115_g12756 [Alternaria tenuissima]RYO00257.1 hypothetical protein AA0121_g13431 [Alternaria tenuissima]